jgi:hypothetical protein
MTRNKDTALAQPVNADKAARAQAAKQQEQLI